MQTASSPPTFDFAIQRLQQRLSGPLPGRTAFMRMAPENPGHRKVEEARLRGCREGGVLLLLYPNLGEAHIALTLRSDSLRTHAGQISLPGGRLEAGETPVEGALREAWEELRILPGDLEVLGTLSPLYIPPSNFCLTPVVAAAFERPHFQPDSAEVAELIEAPVRCFIEATYRRLEMRRIAGVERQIPFYQVGRHKVWGATAMVLSELAEVWQDAVG